MRPVMHGDISAVARALLYFPVRRRASTLQIIFTEAEAADKYRKTTGRCHPLWGNGSLMSAANARPQAQEPYLDDLEYCGILALTFESLLTWRLAQRKRGKKDQSEE